MEAVEELMEEILAEARKRAKLRVSGTIIPVHPQRGACRRTP